MRADRRPILNASHDRRTCVISALAGITVVGLEQAVAAPFATRQVADLGARVIKVERPGGGDTARRYDRAVPRRSRAGTASAGHSSGSRGHYG
jgi:crotonobetainyl-CoA:carnitine CoA-transferase CaiB-like acyl-CoA transferase